jgi:hypothetical protein
VWVEKRQVSGEINWQAKISVPARSRTRNVTAWRIVGQEAIKILFLSILAQAAGTGGPQKNPFKWRNLWLDRILNF